MSTSTVGSAPAEAGGAPPRRAAQGVAEVTTERGRRFPLWVREIVFVAAIYTCYEFTRGLHQGGFAIAARNGRDLLRWERTWDIDPEHWLTQAITHLTPLAVVASYFYSTMHYLITPIVLVWMYRQHKESYGHARTVLAISTILGLVGFYLIPTAPPRLLAHSGVRDVLLDVHQYGWWGGDGSVPRGLGGLSNQFAAMPSLHVGWALWCGVLIYRHASKKWVRWLGLSYPVATTIVVVATGNHYLLDAFAGALVMGMGLLLTRGLERLHGRIVRNRLTRPGSPVAPALAEHEALD